MRFHLLGFIAGSAAILTVSSPAVAAPHWSSPGRAAEVGVTVHRGGPPPGGLQIDHGDWNDEDWGGDWSWGERRGHGVRGRRGAGLLYYDSDAWAHYNNRSFAPDSYNDWWHDRPDRAFPRWMQTNQNCERQWWSGGVWRC